MDSNEEKELFSKFSHMLINEDSGDEVNNINGDGQDQNSSSQNETSVEHLDINDETDDLATRFQMVSPFSSVKPFRPIQPNPDKKCKLSKTQRSLLEEQEILQTLLCDVVAYVEINLNKKNLSEEVKAKLRSMGATVVERFSKKVTHCFFRDGRLMTYKRAIDWDVPLVSEEWIDACRIARRQVDENCYQPFEIEKFKDDLATYGPAKRVWESDADDSKVSSEVRKTAAKSNNNAAETVTSGSLLGFPPEAAQAIEECHSDPDGVKKLAPPFDKILPRLNSCNKDGDDKILKDPPYEVRRWISVNKSSMDSERRWKSVNKSSMDSESDSSDDKTSSSTNSDDETSSSNNSDDETSSSNNSDDDDDSSNDASNNSDDDDDLFNDVKKQTAETRSSSPAEPLPSTDCNELLLPCQPYRVILSACYIVIMLTIQNGLVQNQAQTNENTPNSSKMFKEKADGNKNNEG